MLPERIRLYLLRGLETTPDLLDRLLGDVSDPAAYDRRPDPERFTLREVLAHLADWEEVFRRRLRQTLDEDNPKLLGLDEGKLAVERDYAHADPVECRARFRRGRAELLADAARPDAGPVGAGRDALRGRPAHSGNTGRDDRQPRRLPPPPNFGMAAGLTPPL